MSKSILFPFAAVVGLMTLLSPRPAPAQDTPAASESLLRAVPAVYVRSEADGGGRGYRALALQQLDPLPAEQDETTTTTEPIERLHTYDWTIPGDGRWFFEPTLRDYQTLIYDERIARQNEIDRLLQEKREANIAGKDAQELNMMRAVLERTMEDRVTTEIDGKMVLLYQPKSSKLVIPDGAFRGSDLSETTYLPGMGLPPLDSPVAPDAPSSKSPVAPDSR